MAYSDNNQLGQAIKTYQRGIEINPHVPNFYHNTANAYVSLGNFDLAEKYFLKAIEVDPQFIFSWQSLASLYQQTNQKEKLEKLLKSVPH